MFHGEVEDLRFRRVLMLRKVVSLVRLEELALDVLLAFLLFSGDVHLAQKGLHSIHFRVLGGVQ